MVWLDNRQFQVTIDLRFDIEMGSDHATNFILREEGFKEASIDFAARVHFGSR